MAKIARTLATFLAASALGVGARAQAPGGATPSQTARQALIEMFFSKTPGTFARHLPAATLSALESSGASTRLQQYSVLAGQLQTKGKTFETFETGSVLFSAADPQAGTKFQITVENDSLSGEEDDIEVSFQSSKNNEPQHATPGFMPRMTFGMKMESGVWKLNEILVTLRVPLADPDFLKGITEALKPRTPANGIVPSQVQTSPGQTLPGQTSPGQASAGQATVTFGSDASVQAAMRSIVAAEVAYFSSYPAVGYTCTLSDLDGFGGGQPNAHQAMLLASGLASGKKYGYLFTLWGCTGSPATGFHLVAAPAGNGFGRRAFCADQSAAIRYATDGNAATCLATGTPVP